MNDEGSWRWMGWLTVSHLPEALFSITVQRWRVVFFVLFMDLTPNYQLPRLCSVDQGRQHGRSLIHKLRVVINNTASSNFLFLGVWTLKSRSRLTETGSDQSCRKHATFFMNVLDQWNRSLIQRNVNDLCYRPEERLWARGDWLVTTGVDTVWTEY